MTIEYLKRREDLNFEVLNPTRPLVHLRPGRAFINLENRITFIYDTGFFPNSNIMPYNYKKECFKLGWVTNKKQ